MLQKLYLIVFLMFVSDKKCASKNLRSFAKEVEGPAADHQLRYPEPLNQQLLFSEDISDDHVSEPIEVKGSVENGSDVGEITEFKPDPKNNWNNDDDQEPLSCSPKRIVEEQGRRMTCLSLLENLYDLAKGYEDSDTDISVPTTLKSTRVRRQIRLVSDIIDHAIDNAVNVTTKTTNSIIIRDKDTSSVNPPPVITESPAPDLSSMQKDSSNTVTISLSDNGTFIDNVSSSTTSMADSMDRSTLAQSKSTLPNTAAASSSTVPNPNTGNVSSTNTNDALNATITKTSNDSSSNDSSSESNEDDDMSEYIILEPGATRPVKHSETKASKASKTTTLPTTKVPFSKLGDRSEDEVNPFILTEPASNSTTVSESGITLSQGSTSATTSGLTLTSTQGIASTTLSGPASITAMASAATTLAGSTSTISAGGSTSATTMVSTTSHGNNGLVGISVTVNNGSSNGEAEIGAWITQWKQTVDNALPGFLPDSRFSDMQKIVRNNVCTRLATLPYVVDRCCVTMSIVCPEFMTPKEIVEPEIQIKTVNGNQAAVNSNTDGNINVDYNNNNFGPNENSNNNNNNNNNRYNLRNLVSDTVQSLARLVGDMIKNMP